jgi:predicted O-methyltransferase YrrM
MAGKVAVLYHFFEKNEDYRENLTFFLRAGIIQGADYFIIVAGGCSINLPIIDGVQYVFTPNDGFDFGGYCRILNGSFAQVYDHIIFVNCTVRGPFTPAYLRLSWIEVFKQMISGDVKLAGAMINMLDPNSVFAQGFVKPSNLSGPHSHVQTQAFIMDKECLSYLMAKKFFQRNGVSDYRSTIVRFEIMMSQLVLSNGWNISCLLPEYSRIDYRSVQSDINSTSYQGDAGLPNTYFRRSAHPFETIFCKTERELIDPNTLANLSRSQLSFAQRDTNRSKINSAEERLSRITTAWSGHKNFARWILPRVDANIIVDLGVDCGYSSLCFATVGKGDVYGIDSFEGDANTGFTNTYREAKAAADDLHFGNVHFIKGSLHEVAQTWNKQIDILHIDGSHEYEEVSRDYLDWKKFVRAGGVIMLHDTCVPHFGGRRVFDEISMPKLNFSNSQGLGVLSSDRNLISEIAETFSGLIEMGSVKL